MKTHAARQVVLAVAALTLLSFSLLGQTNSVTSTSLAAQEAAGCKQNLKVIYEAIEAYRLAHRDLPNWLSDLVPDYLPDVNVLVCPTSRRTGKTEGAPLADPKIPSSYLFEFCPLPLGNMTTNSPNSTRREWKRRQMGLLGSVVPIVRCRQHNPALNLSFDGRIYESPGMWELAFTNRVSAADLTAARLFANEPAPARKPPANGERKFPPRDPKAPAQLLDLTPYYNAALTQSWHGGSGNDLASLPAGVQTFVGIDFDARGIVQLRSKSPSSTNFPAEVKGIRVRQQCQKLHFLHAAAFGTVVDEGQQLGTYVVHFATNQMRLEIPIVYGKTVRNWHTLGGEGENKELTVAWLGENAVSKKAGRKIRLFLTTWSNLAPSVPIESVDFVSTMATPAPFLVAITAE